MNGREDQERIARFRPRLAEELAEIETLDLENAAWSAPVELDQQSVGRVSRIDAMQLDTTNYRLFQRLRIAASAVRL